MGRGKPRCSLNFTEVGGPSLPNRTEVVPAPYLPITRRDLFCPFPIASSKTKLHRHAFIVMSTSGIPEASVKNTNSHNQQENVRKRSCLCPWQQEQNDPILHPETIQRLICQGIKPRTLAILSSVFSYVKRTWVNIYYFNLFCSLNYL